MSSRQKNRRRSEASLPRQATAALECTGPYGIGKDRRGETYTEVRRPKVISDMAGLRPPAGPN